MQANKSSSEHSLASRYISANKLWISDRKLRNTHWSHNSNGRQCGTAQNWSNVGWSCARFWFWSFDLLFRWIFVFLFLVCKITYSYTNKSFVVCFWLCRMSIVRRVFFTFFPSLLFAFLLAVRIQFLFFSHSNLNYLTCRFYGISLPSYFIYYPSRVFQRQFNMIKWCRLCWSSCVIFNSFGTSTFQMRTNSLRTKQNQPFMYVAFIDLHILAWFHHDAVAEIFFSLIHNMYKWQVNISKCL